MPISIFRKKDEKKFAMAKVLCSRTPYVILCHVVIESAVAWFKDYHCFCLVPLNHVNAAYYGYQDAIRFQINPIDYFCFLKLLRR